VEYVEHAKQVELSDQIIVFSRCTFIVSNLVVQVAWNGSVNERFCIKTDSFILDPLFVYYAVYFLPELCGAWKSIKFVKVAPVCSFILQSKADESSGNCA